MAALRIPLSLVVLSCTVRAAEAGACQTGAAAEDAYAAPLAAASHSALCLPRVAGLSGAERRDVLSKVAGFLMGPVATGNAFPAFIRSRYSGLGGVDDARADGGRRPAGGDEQGRRLF